MSITLFSSKDFVFVYKNKISNSNTIQIQTQNIVFVFVLCSNLSFVWIAQVCFAQCSTSRLALGSRGCCSFVWSSPCPIYLWKPYTAIFLKSPRSKDIKTDISNCQIHKYTNTNINTQIQTHTYSFVEVPSRAAKSAGIKGLDPSIAKDLIDSEDPKHTLFCRETAFVAIYALFKG